MYNCIGCWKLMDIDALDTIVCEACKLSIHCRCKFTYQWKAQESWDLHKQCNNSVDLV